MKANDNAISEKMWQWLDGNTPEDRKKIWAELTAGTEPEQAEEGIYTFVSALLQSAKEKQELAEERQILLNKRMEEKADADKNLQSVREKLEEAEQAVRKTEERMKEYERQFVLLQESVKSAQERDEQQMKTEAELRAVKADRDNALARQTGLEQENREIKEKTERLERELAAAKEYGTDMAMQAARLEKLFTVRVYRKLHKA